MALSSDGQWLPGMMMGVIATLASVFIKVLKPRPVGVVIVERLCL